MSAITVLADLGYDKCPAQRGPMKSKARFVCMVAGTRGGKTRTAAKKFLARILRDIQRANQNDPTSRHNVSTGVGKDRRPRLHYWVVSPTHALLREPKRYLFETIPAVLFEDAKRPLNHEGQMWLKGDVLIEFRSADNPMGLVSVGLHGMWLDEAARIKGEAWSGNLRGRLTDKNGWCLFSSTPLGLNWLHEEVYRLGVASDTKHHDDFASFHWHTADNLTIDRAEIESARATMPARYFKREYEADFSAFLGNIYDEFSDAAHVVTEAQLRYDYGWGMRPLRELFRQVVCGVDWGWTDPAAMIVIGDTGRERIILDEVYAPGLILFDPRAEDNTLVGKARGLQMKWGLSQFFCDPSQPHNIEQFRRSGLSAVGATNDVAYGIRRMTEHLHLIDGKPRLRVMASCKNFIREVKSYVWDDLRGTENFKDMPKPNQSDHALDAGRYSLLGLVRYGASDEGESYFVEHGVRPIG